MSTASAKSRTWFITGCSTGIGREIASAVLARGDRAAVTARKTEAVADLLTEYPDQAIGLALDVTVPEQVASAVAEAEAALGGIDVLVNNAGYGYMAALEEGEDQEVRQLFDTNFFGVVDTIKAVLPGMRARGNGYIMNMSSMTGLVTNPPNIYYSASKHALEALTEGLAKEVEPFGIRVTAIEPGAFRTDWATRSMKESATPIADYAETVGARKELIKMAGDLLPGDPRRIADAVLMLADLESPPLHLLLGEDVLNAFRDKLVAWQALLDEWEAVTRDVNFS
ncbi:MAG: SDR family NAD(P)-dependent oxidoreductase [Halioglobus sp.]|nr:SDR family NAD(P)-dependent oxidoreductase [Halioglobus sp.]